ncbi:MAG: type 4a pilus biogenesis protein PilO [Candidatus Omnitrophica bacterium]|nr:type 4a pilus biogenesis protein PilO [Candidatus Omnitrophota bacterium]MBL7210685.1 type 4a pilus biogenesis protein PilO [Candidatus Omnitrophota bacterium]
MIGNPIKKILELDNKKIALIILASSVLLCLDYYFVIIKLQLQNLRNAAPKIQKFNNDLSNLSLQLDKMQQAKQEHLEEQQRLLREAKKIIPEGQVPSLLEEVADAAKSNSVELTQMKPVRQNLPPAKDKAAAGQNMAPLLIKLDVSCGYHELGHFINDLENNPVFMAVENLTITPQQKDYFKQKVELELKTYVEK